MTNELHVLIVEDSVSDAELLQRELRKAGFVFVARRVETRDAYVEALDSFRPDIVLSDYSMPSFDGHLALSLLRERSVETPFIFVSGCIGEDRAIEALKEGATDYVLKDHMGRLVPAIRRALKDVVRESERKTLDDQLLHSRKMELIGRFAGGVAHDFNNMLTAIVGYAEFVLEQTPEGDPRRADVLEIIKAGERAQSLTRQLLTFSRNQAPKSGPVNLNEVVEGTLRMLRRVVREDVRVDAKLAHDLTYVSVEADRLEQIVMNLAINARDAMPKGGVLSVETAVVRLDADYVRRFPDAKPGRYVMLSVADDGVGMDDATRARIFEPYFTTKPPGEGTGLGLAGVYGVVRRAGGSVSVESAPGRGATFRLYFPLVAPESTAPTLPTNAPPQKTGDAKATILIVESDAAIRALTARTLGDAGYRTATAGDADEAVAVDGRLSRTVDLLVLGATTTGPAGADLIKKLLARSPEMKVLCSSATFDGPDAPTTVLNAEYLEQPATPQELRRKVNEVLFGDARPGSDDRPEAKE